MTTAWVPHPEAAALMGGPPDGVRLICWDGRSAAPTHDLDRVALYVPPTWSKAAAIEALGTLPMLQVIQLLSAGADWILPQVPDGVTLCDAQGVHDPAVAEWVLTALLTLVRRFDEVRRLPARMRSAPAWLGR